MSLKIFSGTENLDNRGVNNEEQQANEESEETATTTSTSEESELGKIYLKAIPPKEMTFCIFILMLRGFNHII
jgi:hypothetical protein